MTDVSLAMPVRLVAVGQIPNVPDAVLGRLHQKNLGTLAALLADAVAAGGASGIDLPPRTALFQYLKDLKIPAGPASNGADAIVDYLESGEADAGASPPAAEAGNDESADTMEAGLKRALHGLQDAEKRWAKLQQAGATDAQIKDAVAYEFGISGAGGGPGRKWTARRGGQDPAFWYDAVTPAGPPTLKGKALIDAVRRVMEIPTPKKGKVKA